MSEEHSIEHSDEEDEEASQDDSSEKFDENDIPGIPDIPGMPVVPKTEAKEPISETIPDIPQPPKVVFDEPVSEDIPEIPETPEIVFEEIEDEKIEEAVQEEIVEEIAEEEVEEIIADEELVEDIQEDIEEELLDELESEDKSLDIETLETNIEESKEQMRTKPSKKVVTLSIVFTILSLLMTLGFAIAFNILFLKKNPKGALPWFPGNFIVEIMVMWILPIAMFFLIIPLYSFFSKMYIRLHKVIKLTRFNYSVVQLRDDPIKFREALGRMIIPLLFLYSIGYWVGTWIFPYELDPNIAIQSLQYFLYSFLFSPVVVLLAIPLWLLEDSGIIAMRKRKEGERKLPDVEGVNNYFHNLYTGSALSIAVVTLVTFIISSIGRFEPGLFGAIVYVFVVLAVESLSFVYLFELFMLRAKKRLLNRLPMKLVDMEPKIVVNLKDVNNNIHEINGEEEEEPIDQY
ncbi:MAG: hypothetical protein ACTSO7_00465 [Candidatus Heimdallarchaeota archaeon]